MVVLGPTKSFHWASILAATFGPFHYRQFQRGQFSSSLPRDNATEQRAEAKGKDHSCTDECC